jgi:polyhydroxyalkanoate synthesis regulator phasin
MNKEAILAIIDEATKPEKMNLEQAHEFLESLVNDIQNRADAIQDDIDAKVS